MIMVLITLIPDIRRDIGLEYGPEFEYILSSTGDAAQYSNSEYSSAYLPEDRADSLPWPDTSVANEWIEKIVCPDNEFVEGIYDSDPPSYLAIVADDYANNANLQALLAILGDKYGDSTVYPEQWLDDKFADGSDWSFPFEAAPFTTSAPTSANVNGSQPTPMPTMTTTNTFYTTTDAPTSSLRRRRNFLATDDYYCDVNVFDASTSDYDR